MRGPRPASRKPRPSQTSISVIIAAKDAERTIARAVLSALAQPQVAEVILVDDGSSDRTAQEAGAAAAGDSRLHVVRLPTNRGPSAARNEAIRRSTQPLIAVLDSDDLYLPARFDRLLARDDWDIVADNIIFVTDDQAQDIRPTEYPSPEAQWFELDLVKFVLGNISRRGAPRGELGFLKPVFRRSFLETHGLGYREEMRLGEDFELCARMLASGARFLVTRGCGYVAVEREDSLSAQHSVADLVRMIEAERELEASFELSDAGHRALRRHEAHLTRKVRHGRFLDEKKKSGFLAAAGAAGLHPQSLADVAIAVAGDKIETVRTRWLGGRSAERRPRMLLPFR